MNGVMRLIALDWLSKQLDEEIASARREVEDHYRERMGREVGEDGQPLRSFRHFEGGKRLASFWFPVSKEVPERRSLKAICYNWQAALEDDNEDFAEWLSEYVKGHIGELAERYVTETGDQIDGVLVTEEVTPAKPGHVGRLHFKPNRDAVDEYMRPRFGGGIAGLLEQ